MKIFATLLAALCLSAPLHAADDVLFRDDFSANAGWSESGKPEQTSFTVANGRFRLVNTVNEASYQSSRDIRVPGPASYRLTFTTTEISASGDNVYYGVALRAPDDDEVGFVLGNQGHARVYYWHDGKWADPVLSWVSAPSMKTGPGAVNRVRIERESGRFHFYVNDVLAGSTRVVDFAPSKVVMTANQVVTVDFDDLVVTRTGTDSRTARLTLQAPVPGQPVLLREDFTRTVKQKLRGNTLKKDDRWALGDDGGRRAQIDYTRELFIYERKQPEGYSWNWAGATEVDPRAWASYSVGAKVRFTATGTGCGGVVVFGHEEKDKEYPMLLGCIHPAADHAQLWFYPRDNSGWESLVDVPTRALVDGFNEVRVVVDVDRVILYVNGEYQGDAPYPSDFQYYGIGMYVDNGTGMELDDFDAREL